MRWIHRRPAAIAALPLALMLPLATAAAQSPQGRTGTLVVLNKGASTATFVDVASGETVATLPTGRGPHELAMTADGRWAVSTDYGGGNSLTVFDVRGPDVVRTIDLADYPRPHGAFFLPGDSILAVTSEASGQVVLVRPFAGVGAGEVADVIAGAISTDARGSHMVAVTGDGTTLYTGDMGSGTVSRLDVASGRRTASFSVAAQPEAVTVSRDGSEVWVGSNADGLVSVLDPVTGAVETAQEGLGWPYRILIIESRDLVVIPDLRGNQVRFVGYASREELDRLDLPGQGPQGVALTPDAGTLFLSLSAAGEVAVIDLDTREIVRRIPVGPTPDGIGWSPITREIER